MENLLQNKMFLQYLAAAGQDIGSGNAIGTNVNQATQQNISAQNYMKILQKMLGGQVPEGGKMVTDSKGMKLDIPHTALSGGFLTDDMSMTPDQSLAPAASPAPASQPKGGIDFTNPFASSQSEISPSDLAGLTTQDISGALSGAMSVEAMKQKKVTDVADMMYKQKMMSYYDSLIDKNKAGEPLDQPFPIEVPGIGGVSIRQWNALTKDQQEYAGYVFKAKQLGDEDIMNEREFKLLEPTERENFLRAAMDDPDLMRAARGLARSGATRISLGEKLEEVKAKAGLKGQTYFKDPKWTNDLDKHISSEDVQNELFQLEEGDVKDTKKAEYKVEFIENKITAGGGSVQDVKWDDDGTTMIWTVKWPSGDVEEIRYAVR